MYYVFKDLCILWKDTGGSWRCLGSMTIRERFWPPMMFSLYEWKIHSFGILDSLKLKLIYIIVLYTVYFDFMFKLIYISIHHWAYSLLTFLLFPFYRLVVILCIERRWSSFRVSIVLCLGSWKIVVSTGFV